MTYLEYGTEDYRRWAALFNDITHAPTDQFVHLGTRQILCDYLWEQGWRREVRPEDVTENRRQTPQNAAQGPTRVEVEKNYPLPPEGTAR